ncbi:hypothetical protein V3C99_001334, partial [Haemonchus contortus]
CYCTQRDVSQLPHLSNVLPLPIPNGVIIAGPKMIPQIHTARSASRRTLRTIHQGSHGRSNGWPSQSLQSSRADLQRASSSSGRTTGRPIRSSLATRPEL